MIQKHLKARAKKSLERENKSTRHLIWFAPLSTSSNCGYITFLTNQKLPHRERIEKQEMKPIEHVSFLSTCLSRTKESGIKQKLGLLLYKPKLFEKEKKVQKGNFNLRVNVWLKIGEFSPCLLDDGMKSRRMFEEAEWKAEGKTSSFLLHQISPLMKLPIFLIRKIIKINNKIIKKLIIPTDLLLFICGVHGMAVGRRFNSSFTPNKRNISIKYSRKIRM